MAQLLNGSWVTSPQDVVSQFEFSHKVPFRGVRQDALFCSTVSMMERMGFTLGASDCLSGRAGGVYASVSQRAVIRKGESFK